MKLYIIRHGQTEWNKKGLWQGQSDICLNKDGEEQAEFVALRLKRQRLNVGRIYASPLNRAYKTAIIINQYIGADIVTREDLKEIYLGNWEGKTVDMIRSKDAVSFLRWESEPDPVLSNNAETYLRLQERAIKSLQEIIEIEGAKKDIIIVTHGAWIRALVCKVLNINLADRLKFDIGNVSVTVIEYTCKDSLRLVTLNDVSHLVER